MATKSKTILTGIKPTGFPHFGNYVGMIKPTFDLIDNNETGKNFVFVANYHALNILKTADQLREYTYDIIASFLALGLDHNKVHFYRQSDIPETFELATILSSVTPKGLMNRAHAYKAAVDANRNKGNVELDDGVNMGLFTYPILMASDILLFNSDLVPVGKDQVQHVEFARDIAGYFNRKYSCEFFGLPEHQISEENSAILGLDGRKMSKSYGNTIEIFSDPKQMRKKVNKIVTDSKLPEEPKDAESSTIYIMYKALANKDEAEALKIRFESGGMGYGDAKRVLADKLEETFSSASKKYKEYLSDKSELENIMAKAAVSAREIAARNMSSIREIIGA